MLDEGCRWRAALVKPAITAVTRRAQRPSSIHPGSPHPCLTLIEFVISNPKAFFLDCFRTKEKSACELHFWGWESWGTRWRRIWSKAGHEVTVWNRTPGKLVEGAGVAPTPAAAAQGAEVVWLCVSDTDAVEERDLRSEGWRRR